MPTSSALTTAPWDWKSTYKYDSLPDGRLFIIPLMLHSIARSYAPDNTLLTF